MDASATPRFSKPFQLFVYVLSGLAAVVALLALMGRLDAEEPTVVWGEYDGSLPRSGTVEIPVTVVDYKPGLRSVVLRIDDGEPIASTPAPPSDALLPRPAVTHLFTVDTAALDDGPHKIAVEARDRSLLPNLGEAFEMLFVDNTPPEITSAAGVVSAAQGHTTALVVRSDEELSELHVLLFDREVPFHRVGGEGLYRALVGFGVAEGPETVEVALRGQDLAGNTTQSSLEVQLEAQDWPAGGYIALSSSQAKAQKDKDKGSEANARRGDAYAHEGGVQLWTGPFQRPAAGPVTSPFGKVRTYSTGAKRHHLGVDIANTTGTPVVAPAAGVVTLAEELHVYGNAVILSHGHGISSSYNHLDEIDVQVGDRVARGQRLGAVGSTGQSTGAHLHWGMVANGIAVDPMQWLEDDFEVTDP